MLILCVLLLSALGQGEQKIASAEDIHQKVFSEIYTNKVWGTNKAGEGFSGGGSLVKNTKSYMKFLEKFMRRHGIQSVVDIGCGDWEFSQYIDWKNIKYTGYDVVPFVIEKNQKKFGSRNIKFVHGNFLSIDLPSADLLICKHVLQHLTNEDILSFLSQLSKFKYCLITNEVYPETLSSDNPDIAVGGGHKIDLTKPPFLVEGKRVLDYKVGDASHQVFLIQNR